MIRRKLTKNPTRIGTSYFKSISDAVRYYRDYDLDREDVMEKIRKGEIHIGKPPVRDEEHIILDPLENRYFYQTRNPRKKVTRIKVGRNPTMTKSEVSEYFQENVLPYVIRRYESDHIIDAPARREAWNDMIDVLIKDGQVLKSAENWALPSQFREESEIKKNPRRKITKRKSRRNPECCTELDPTSLKESARKLLGNEYTPDRERKLLDVYKKYKNIIERGTFNEDKVNDVISAFDKVLLNYGVEHMRPSRLEDYEEKVITYSNTGDTYNPTILHVDGKFWIGSWGDVVENDYEMYSSKNPRKRIKK